MKVYISADIEGVTGVTDWEETDLGHHTHPAAAAQMKREVMAAVKGALAAGAKEIYVKDAHDSGRNMDFTGFPEEVTLIRSWTNTPESMMAGLDESFDAVIYIGYHSAAYGNGNPLAHTMNTANNYFKVNGEFWAEFDLNSLIAAHYGVPVVFLSGDEALCERAKSVVPNMETVGVKKGIGEATFNMATDKALKLIEAGVKKGLKKIKKCMYPTADKYTMEINYKEHVRALRASYYPGVKQVDEHVVRFTAKNVPDLIACRMFIL